MEDIIKFELMLFYLSGEMILCHFTKPSLAVIKSVKVLRWSINQKEFKRLQRVGEYQKANLFYKKFDQEFFLWQKINNFEELFEPREINQKTSHLTSS